MELFFYYSLSRYKSRLWLVSFQDHSPPSTLIMKKGGWVVGSMNKTILLNKEGNEEAVRLSREERKSSGSYR